MAISKDLRIAKDGGLRLLRGVILCLLVATLSACGESHSWRQKTIIEVETPHGVVSGGSVSEMRVSYFGWLEKKLSASAMSYDQRGEASFVEVAPGRYLFALLQENQPTLTVAIFSAGAKEKNRETAKQLESLRESRDITQSQYIPMLVTFDDINDPRSVKLVDPNDLAATFGAGFRLKTIRLEITDEKVSQGKVATILPWQPTLVGSIGKNMGLPYDHLLNQVLDASFSRGIAK